MGERVRFEGDIEVEKECRVDIWCEIEGNVLVGEDAYLGERVSISGKLVVGGDLDIGDDVHIEEGFEANGWINIRNPLPTIIFLFMYIFLLLLFQKNFIIHVTLKHIKNAKKILKKTLKSKKKHS